MSKQSFKKVILFVVSVIIVFIMFGLFKNFFSKPDDEALVKAIRGGAFLVDVRTAGEFASGSASGAVNIPLDEIVSRIHEFKNKETIIVFCRSGNRSGQVYFAHKPRAVRRDYGI